MRSVHPQEVKKLVFGDLSTDKIFNKFTVMNSLKMYLH